MLQNLRDYFPRWLIVVFLSLLMLSMVFLGLYSPQGEESKNPNAPIIHVNGKTIRRSMVDRSYEALKQNQQMQLGANFRITPSIEQQWRLRALEQLVITEVLKQQAQSQGYRIHMDDFLKLLKEIPLFQIKGQFSAERFEEVIRASGYTRASFLKRLEEDSIIHQVRHGILNSAFILPAEAKQARRLVKQQRDFRYVEIPLENFLKSNVTTSEQEIQRYYDQHLTQFRLPEQVDIEYVTLSLSEVTRQLQTKHPEWNKAQLREYASQQFKEAVNTLSHLSYTQPHSLVETAQTLQAPLHSTGLFSRTGSKVSITKHPEFITAAFSKEVLDGYNSHVISLSSDQVCVLRLKQYQPIQLPALSAIRKVVVEKLKREKAKELLQAHGKKWVEQLKADPYAKLELLSPLSWQTVHGATRYDKKIPSVVLNAAFKIPHAIEDKTITGFMLPNGNYVLVHLLQVNMSELNATPSQQAALYQEELAAEMGELDYNLYVREMLQKANISHQLNP